MSDGCGLIKRVPGEGQAGATLIGKMPDIIPTLDGG